VETTENINRGRLALLIKEAGSQAKLAERIGKAPAQISQWLNASKDSKTGKPRAMDRDTRRELERKCGKPEGWMDQPLPPGENRAPAVGAPAPAVELKPEYLQLLADLETLLPRERSRWMDQIHQAAEYVREIRSHDAETDKVAHATRGRTRATATAQYGDGNAAQGTLLPLSTVPDPFTAAPGERESELYKRLEVAPKGSKR
jgi:transcriptional regulator with XRE-family HTH domain